MRVQESGFRDEGSEMRVRGIGGAAASTLPARSPNPGNHLIQMNLDQQMGFNRGPHQI